jgi:hypothetical protein
MARQSKKKSLLDDPATAALMKELGMGKQEAPPPVKKVVRKRRGKQRCPGSGKYYTEQTSLKPVTWLAGFVGMGPP